MKRHRTDVLSLVFGLGFLLVVLGWLTRTSFDVQLPAFGWLVAVGLIVAGSLGLYGAMRGTREPVAVAPHITPAGPADLSDAELADLGLAKPVDPLAD